MVQRPPTAPASAGASAPASKAGSPALDAAHLSEQVLAKVGPMLENDLRQAASELFQVQIITLMPALQSHIEAAVRKAIHEVLHPRPPA